MSTTILPSTIKDNLPEILQVCLEFGVQRLEVFGSIVSGQFDHARSDIDFLVEYPQGYDFGPWGERHFALKDRLAELLGRPVDLIVPRNIENPYLRASIEDSRRLIYAA